MGGSLYDLRRHFVEQLNHAFVREAKNTPLLNRPESELSVQLTFPHQKASLTPGCH